MGVKVTGCCFCFNPVSEMGGFTKLSLNRVAHTECYLNNAINPRLSEQEKVLTESFFRREQELLTTINQLKLAKGETSTVVSRESTTVFDTATWDEEAEKVCKLAVAQIGPTLPLHTLKRYAWFIYTQLRDRKLIQPLQDDKAEESPNERQLRVKEEMETWLRENQKK